MTSSGSAQVAGHREVDSSDSLSYWPIPRSYNNHGSNVFFVGGQHWDTNGLSCNPVRLIASCWRTPWCCTQVKLNAPVNGLGCTHVFEPATYVSSSGTFCPWGMKKCSGDDDKTLLSSNHIAGDPFDPDSHVWHPSWLHLWPSWQHNILSRHGSRKEVWASAMLKMRHENGVDTIYCEPCYSRLKDGVISSYMYSWSALYRQNKQNCCICTTKF